MKLAHKYDPSNLAKTGNTFTTVYMGNYVSGDFNEGSGSHCGVDIFPAKTHDAIMACLPGTVTVAVNKGSNGNHVIIEHQGVPSPDGHGTTTLYSCYLHLSEFSVSVGQVVAEGEEIGKCGNTGNVAGSTGEHLHFQIDTGDAPFHPYWPFSSKEASDAGLGFFQAVNVGLGRENAEKYTVNPLVYLDSVGSGSSIPKPEPLVRPPESVTPVMPVTPVVPTPPIMPVQPVTPEPVAPVQPTAKGYADVPESHPYASGIAVLRDKGIVSASNPNFRPQAPVTRGELVKMVVRALGVQPEVVPSSFSDVETGSEFSSYVEYAKANKIVGGYPDGTFHPNSPVSRAEGVKIVINAFEGGAPESVSFQVFSDVDPSEWYAPYAVSARTNALFDLSSDTFQPNAAMNRGEIAQSLSFYLSK